MKKISAVIITYNETENVNRVLRSVAWCDEIIVVDSGSSDDTVAKAVAGGARTVARPFDGYGAQKTFAVSQANNNWVLSVDADEEVSPELRDAIMALPEDCQMSGYYLTRIDRFNSKVLKHSLGGQGLLLRLFDRRKGNFNQNTIHESVEIVGRTGKLKGAIYHDPYRSISAYFDKFNRYTTMMAQSKFDHGKKTSPFIVLIRFPLALVDSIIFKRGFLDGYEGVLMGIFHAMYTTVKYAKLLELKNRKEN